MIDTHDPNIRWAKKTFRLTFMSWDYQVTLEATVGGNCHGFDNISAAVGQAYEELPVDMFGVPFLTMKRADGDELHVGDEEDRDERWLMDLLVHAEITSIVPEVRA